MTMNLVSLFEEVRRGKISTQLQLDLSRSHFTTERKMML